MRAGAVLATDPEGEDVVGTVTSGGFGPNVDGPVAMGYVAKSASAPGTQLYAGVRGKFLPVTVAAMPFVKPTFKR